MAVTTMLKKDHEVLRRKLEFLEAALQVTPQMPFVLREMCHSLARILDEHIHREDEALMPYANRIRTILRYRADQDHADQRLILRDVNALLLLGIKMPTGKVVSLLSHLIEELREHMAEEEREVFPAVDEAEEEHHEPEQVLKPLIAEHMSANAIMKAFPATRRVFEKHGVTCGCEGCDCLNELAWRRGLEAKELVKELQQAAAEPKPEEQEAMCA